MKAVSDGGWLARFSLQASLLFWAVAFLIVACLLLGGGTRAGFLSDAILQLLSVPVLIYALWVAFETRLSSTQRTALWFCLAVVALPLIQLIPLPPSVWSVLPQRELIVEAHTAATGRLNWFPLSVSPHATWLSLASLIPPMGVFVGTLFLSFDERRWLSLVILGVGVVSVLLGLLQVAQGPSSPLRLFEYTNLTEAVGFFANRNHFASLLYCLTLLIAVWVVTTTKRAKDIIKYNFQNPVDIVWIAASLVALISFIAAQGIARSRAGLGLTMIAFVGVGLLIGRRAQSTQGSAQFRLVISVILVAIFLVVQLSLFRVLERFEADPLQDARIGFTETTIKAALNYLPFGSGVGTFVPAYATFEQPKHLMVNAYANRAHNDVLEFWLEGGVLALALILAFAFLTIRQSIRIWRKGAYAGAGETDLLLMRAATIVVLLIALHSFADYPLRTSAIGSIFAFACALMVSPQNAGIETRESRHSLTVGRGRA